jgi:hypothetical protein
MILELLKENEIKVLNIKEYTYNFKAILYKNNVENEFKGFIENDLSFNDLKNNLLTQLKKDGYKQITNFNLILDNDFKNIYILPNGLICPNLENAQQKIKDYNNIRINLYNENLKKDIENKQQLENLNNKEKYLNLYLNTLKSEMLKGKVKKTLYTLIKSNNLILNKFEWLQNLKDSIIKTDYSKHNYTTKKGYVEKWVYCAYYNDNAFYELNKTEFEYLNFLRGLKC